MWTQPSAQLPVFFFHSIFSHHVPCFPGEELGWWDFISRWVTALALQMSPWQCGLLVVASCLVWPLHLQFGCVMSQSVCVRSQFGYVLLCAALPFVVTVERDSWWAAVTRAGGSGPSCPHTKLSPVAGPGPRFGLGPQGCISPRAGFALCY